MSCCLCGSTEHTSPHCPWNSMRCENAAGVEQRIEIALDMARKNGGGVTSSALALAIKRDVTCARNVLRQTVARGLLVCRRRKGEDALYSLPPEIEVVSHSFGELLSAWGIPGHAPNCKPGRVHLAFA